MAKINSPLGTGKRTSKKATTLAEPAMAPTSLAGPDDEYKVKSAFDDLMRAETHKQDPELMAKVHKHAKGQLKSIKNVKDLVDYKNAKYGAGSFGQAPVNDTDTDGE